MHHRRLFLLVMLAAMSCGHGSPSNSQPDAGQPEFVANDAHPDGPSICDGECPCDIEPRRTVLALPGRDDVNAFRSLGVMHANS
jgi:hypothetical protein